MKYKIRTETEDPNNIIGMCKKCSDKRRADFQKIFNKDMLKVGDYVKICFKQGKKREHMWVKIISIDKKIFGLLDNEPVLVDNVKYQDIVRVKLSEVEDLLPADRCV